MIKRVLSLLIILSLPLFAVHYNSTVLELEAKLFPKMILLSEEIDKESQYLEIYIIAKEIDTRSAQDMKKSIKSNYPDKIMGKEIVVSIKQFKDFAAIPDAIIVLHHDKKELTKIALWANENRVISLAYDPSYMKHGILASIYVGKSTKPYLNAKIIQKYGFIFNPYLLKLSKFR